jgi:hypothetical protein
LAMHQSEAHWLESSLKLLSAGVTAWGIALTALHRHTRKGSPHARPLLRVSDRAARYRRGLRWRPGNEPVPSVSIATPADFRGGYSCSCKELEDAAGPWSFDGLPSSWEAIPCICHRESSSGVCLVILQSGTIYHNAIM